MGYITDSLNSIDVSKENTIELYNIFRLVPDFEIPIVRFYLYKGTSLIRQRVNLKGRDFNKVSDLGCPPAYCINKYERANLPYQSMFYACCFPGGYGLNDGVIPPRVITLMETSSFYRDKSKNGIERSTVSRWELVQDMELVAMPFLADYNRACNLIKEIKSEWNDITRQSEVNPEGLELVMYMASEIGKNFSSNIEYFKIANFTNYLLNINEKTKNVDGILYPSVPGEGAGFNVAIKPNSFLKKVKFVRASKCYLAKKKDEAFQKVVNNSISVIDGLISYEDKEVNKQEEDYYLQFAEGIDFIN